MIDLIVKEELNRIEENYRINTWTLNIIYYTTAVTLLENEGHLREERRTQNPYKKPGWQDRKTIWESDNTQSQIYASYVKART